MLEKIYALPTSNEKSIGKIVDDDNIGINHIILTKGDALPEHYSNSNVYMIIVKGTMTLKLDAQEPHNYSVTQIINIPYNTKMNVSNSNDDILEFFVVKSPNPRNYK